ncbi:type II toxin-antitoxin system RelE/ParE family toxin [Dyella nitratireducens]|uniref:Toxin, RelE family protein n=1 Tax=Dyella nitratireducens TaxID=1849580 RepID=A0ABQ1GIS9_9GAMM|nr:type II toxin-antitoxin system RelE/ParE family toxin [Dyella nitratireducens]GGA44254.1 toxin, RelE family protein [Dyella nitratireducens]GLQ41768.1 toxin, RelE family protein [Dyella nitratireducens]
MKEMEIRTTNVFDTWFAKLRDHNAKARIQVRIKRLARGNPGQTRTLTDGVQEMKIDYGPGYRVYFTERKGLIFVLLIGGDKTTQTEDIKRAIVVAKALEDA